MPVQGTPPEPFDRDELLRARAAEPVEDAEDEADDDTELGIVA